MFVTYSCRMYYKNCNICYLLTFIVQMTHAFCTCDNPPKLEPEIMPSAFDIFQEAEDVNSNIRIYDDRIIEDLSPRKIELLSLRNAEITSASAENKINELIQELNREIKIRASMANAFRGNIKQIISALRMTNERTIDHDNALTLHENKLSQLSELLEIIKDSEHRTNAMSATYAQPEHNDKIVQIIKENADLRKRVDILDQRLEKLGKELNQRAEYSNDGGAKKCSCIVQ